MSVELSEIKQALDQLSGLAPRYRHFAEYYGGKQHLNFATEKFENAFGQLFSTFADNLCAVPVDAIADRLQIEAFDSKNDVYAAKANEIWAANRMDRRAGEIHTNAPKLGDAYVIVWPGSDGAPRLWPQNTENIVVTYDQEDSPDVIVQAVKRWRQADGRWRLNFYFPDRIEKMITRNAVDSPTYRQFTAYESANDSDEVGVIENPWGVTPVFHFPNNATTGGLGRSELADVISLQDALNKSMADMLVAMEFVALPQRYIAGIQMEIDPVTGASIPPAGLKSGADRVWTVPDFEAKFGQFAPASLEQFLSVQDNFRVEIARITGLPLHYVQPGNGTPPSGEALKVAEARTNKKARDRMAAFGSVWEEALSLAVRQALGILEPLKEPLSCTWENPETRDDLHEAQTQLVKQQLGVSQQQSLRELGYTDQDIARMATERNQTEAEVGEALLIAAASGTSASQAQGAAALNAAESENAL